MTSRGDKFFGIFYGFCSGGWFVGAVIVLLNGDIPNVLLRLILALVNIFVACWIILRSDD